MSAEGLMQASDGNAWTFARENGYVIVSADSDFYQMAITSGHPPKVIWLKGCDYPTAMVERLLRSQAIRIAEFENDPEQSVLVIQPH